MRKTSGNAFLGQSRKVSFSYFPKVALDHGDHGGAGVPWGVPPCNIQFKPYATSKMEYFR